MRTGSKQKLKYVIILEILRQETDADHPMQTNTLLKKLEEQGIECSRETLYSDIKALNENGFEIFCNRSSSNEYYIEDRGFDVPEIRILIDAVNAASFITPKKTVELVGKVAALGGSHRGEIMKSETKIYNTTKHSNEYIYYIIGHSCSRFCKLRTVVTRYLCAITLLAYKFKTKQGFQKIYKMRENN